VPDAQATNPKGITSARSAPVLYEGGVSCCGDCGDFCHQTHYRITTQSIEVSSGVCCKSVEHIEMWRVKDVGYSQTCFDACCGYGTIVLDTNDTSVSQLTIRGVKNSRELYAKLRDAMINAPRMRMEN